MSLTRADLEAERLQEWLTQAKSSVRVLTEAELQDSIQHTLQQRPQHPVWIFAYGSLIWNPILHYSDRQPVTVYGWHRRFCLQTTFGRGTPDHPGLLLGLDRGGSCRGVAFKVEAADMLAELLLLWRREMLMGSYIPRWVTTAHQGTGDEQIREAIAFVINRQHRAYKSNLTLEETIDRIATAHGQLGSCADYLNNTVDGLLALGISDRSLIRLRDRVKAKQAAGYQ